VKFAAYPSIIGQGWQDRKGTPMGIDWAAVLIPQVSLVELFLRGTAIYLFLFALLRVLVRRHVGTFNLTDMLVIVLIADAAQNAMAAEYRSVPEGFVLCGTIVGWSYVLDWLGYRYRWIGALLEPKPLRLIQKGKLMRRNMRAELVTTDELMSHLRQHGIENVHEVREAYIEPDGQISVFEYHDDGDERDPPPKKKSGL
jgi:uncharacterized membrane protein YcaP (DUF421 family)